ncbi:hypothetical protein LAZ67_2003360 [Cordylochernes scorpioides]|uniref:ATP-dependent DNA helicase n=1 Tax=Cordylochernes scorpioides TaxID=51811 RepID=A0ABY6K2S1_9ARAC|nr:hypothetical protein LAZ67_2003360 [Cordylochernes scorpioides]
MVDTTKDFETVDSELEDVTPLDEKLLREGLQLSGKLENIFIQNDNDVERALKFQRDLKFCMSGYRELYKELVKSPQRLITDYLVKEKKITEVPKEALPCRSDDVILSSSDESDLAPIHKREEMQIGTQMYASLTPDQKSIVNTIVYSVKANPCCLFIDKPNGTENTYVYNTLIRYVRAIGIIVITLASTAATFLSGGQTAHSRFKPQISSHEDSVGWHLSQ